MVKATKIYDSSPVDAILKYIEYQGKDYQNWISGRDIHYILNTQQTAMYCTSRLT